MTLFDRILPTFRLQRQLNLTADLEPPLRAEVFGLDRLEAHARHLAETDRLSADPRQELPLLPRFYQNRQALFAAQRSFAAEGALGHPISPIAEWLLDNFYIIQNHLQEIEQDLGGSYYQELPKLAAGAYAGYPRVYGLAQELIRHTDSRFDLEVLTRFVQAYQRTAPLSTGELWAIAIMLRIGLVENMRRLVVQALATQRLRAEANKWANRLLRVASGPPTQAILVVADLARGYANLDSSFVMHLLERLRDQSPSIAPVVYWLEEWLNERGSNLDTLTRAENQRRAANRVSVGNVVTSLRALTTVDWPDFFEATSPLEAVLRSDPADTYRQMDFATRDRYRHVVEAIAKRMRLAEADVAQVVVELAARHAAGKGEEAPDRERLTHVGYYLIDRGRAELDARLHYRPAVSEAAVRWLRRPVRTVLAYLGSIALLTGVCLMALLTYAAQSGLGPAARVALALLAVVPVSVVGVSLVNWVVTVFVTPHVIPKLEFTGDIAPAYRTVVVVPALLSTLEDVETLFDNLEIRYLANRDPQLHFALLGDFADAPQQHRPEDGVLIEVAKRRAGELNERYGAGRATPFYYLQRERRWNAQEQVWMGWERKRGKLLEFNRLLRGRTDTTYSVYAGDTSILPAVKYIITLDADTELPINSAKRLIGAMAHPLNRPVIDPRKRIIVDGYGILQPRTAVTAVAATGTLFARAFAGETGLDPYSTAVSAVYQDLFGVGSYIGKAIYDVDAVLAVLDGRFPENLLLSHDLLEGSYVRAGQVTDVQLLEDFPSGSDAYMQRQHRWIRGDWQIIAWLLPRVPAGPGNATHVGAGRSVPNPLPLIARWKILDNLRQSLVVPAAVVLLVLGWLWLPGSPVAWTAAALLVVWLPTLLGFVLATGIHPMGEPWSAYFRNVSRDLTLTGLRLLQMTSNMLYEALVNSDASLRATVRRSLLHRHLLEWQSADVVERGQARTYGDYWRRMWLAPALAVLLLAAVVVWRPAALGLALPLVVLWVLSPVVAARVSQPSRPRSQSPLPEAARLALRLTARRTWRFYEVFAGPDDHWLPPDNYQVDPLNVVAHRTSPTNIGFLILSALAAYDFGYIGPIELIERLERVFETLGQLDRFRGHYLNWYDTQSLRHLAPGYVSTVDSGNLAASLLVLRQACQQVLEAPVVPRQALPGIADTARALQAAVDAYHPPARRAAAVVKQLGDELLQIEQELGGAAQGQVAWRQLLTQLEPLARSASERAQELDGGPGQPDPGEIRYWSTRLREHVTAQVELLSTLLPWLDGAGEPGHDPAQGLPGLTGPGSAPTLEGLATQPPGIDVHGEEGGAATAEGSARGAGLREALDRACEAAQSLCGRYAALAQRADALARAMDFTFLYKADRQVFSIGYNLATQQLDNSYYDLLASEARLASFVAIAEGQVPARHWFRLSRPLTWAAGSLVALSWGGTMFEYLMPNLLMRHFEHSLLTQSAQAAVRAQQQYGADRHAPWGISESGFYAFDYQFNYQYQSFGVPDLALKRERLDQLVIAPYATFLTLPLDPVAAWANLERLAREGVSGGYGYFEAIDFTPTRRPRGERAGVVKSYMAHHQGMSLVALDNYLNGEPMVARFHAEPSLAAVELLLQERVPRHAALIEPHPEAEQDSRADETPRPPARAAAVRTLVTPHTLTPRTHLLSNGAYQVMVTNAGGGFSAFRKAGQAPAQGLDVTRWRPDLTCDDWGSFIYVKDVVGGQVWSAGFQPVCREPETYSATYTIDRALFQRRDAGIKTDLEIVVSPQDDVELRQLTLTNLSRRPRTLAVTSYAEVALDTPAADLAHPAFSKLFVESEFLASQVALLFHRRPRGSGQAAMWALHQLTTAGPLVGEVEYETDRARFLGRGRSARNPEALRGPLSKTVGAVLDPVMSLRCHVRLAPGESRRLTFVTGVADSREGIVALADRYCDARLIDRAADLAWVYSQIQLRHLSISDEEAHLFQRLASRLLYPDPALRADEDTLAQNVRGQSGLWAYGLSGDLPILVARVDEAGELDLVRDLLHAHEYWRLNNLAVDLVLLNEHPSSYAEGLHGQVQAMIDTSLSRPWQDKPGGVFLRRADHMPPEDRTLLLSVARVVLTGDLGSLGEQLERSPRQGPGGITPSKVVEAESPPPGPPSPAPEQERQFYNGTGGFSRDGREYIITLSAGQWSPAPWINVLANEGFGCLVTESGLGYTWAENSQLNRLTPWSNDPVSDPPGEALYVRDEASGEVWTPTPLPMREHDERPYRIRHGAGYSVYERLSHGVAQELLVCVPRDQPLKIARLRLTNTGRQTRQLTVTAYVDWVLGGVRSQAQYFIATERDAPTGALFARNTYTADFSQRIAFASLDLVGPAGPPADSGRNRREPGQSYTTDRTEFIGRNRTLAHPAALERPGMMGRVGAGFDACAALQARVLLPPGATREVIFLLGQTAEREAARALIQRYRDPAKVEAALDELREFWDEALGRVQVQTPEPEMDLLLNRWLLYEVLACRLWARSAFYQSGGAYGYRDQLQDVMALTFTRPDLAREHILRAAARQFVEGDVQHWWLPHNGIGPRTRFSDDYLWLPYVAQHYVASTGDSGILDEAAPYLKAPPLEPEQKEVMVTSAAHAPPGSLYEHCRRALDHGLRFGAHGLPLMGTGDWNDGMNSVGDEGRGESVWLGWFLYANLIAWAGLAEARNDAEAAGRYRDQAEQLRQALESSAWDGAWYRRAYYDDGTPLGSAQNEECQIDSIAQSWAALSGGGAAEHVQQAFASAEERLVREQDGLILLLAPPFNVLQPDPGYIKGYVPGIRENGGQYTHAALWLSLGYVERGDGDRAARLFRMINPINHSRTAEAVARYKVEPYVVAADVYAHPQHVGRGGWTWYTGSAGWMYRLGIEGLLGLKLCGGELVVDPVAPAEWPEFRATVRRGRARYAIVVENRDGTGRGVTRVELDGVEQPTKRVRLVDDRREHEVRVVMGGGVSA